MLKLEMHLADRQRQISQYETELLLMKPQQQELEARIALIVENQHKKDIRIAELEALCFELGDRLKVTQLGGMARDEETALRLTQLGE